LGHWDLWGHYHAILALLAWHARTGDPAALAAARAAGGCICATYLDTGRRVIDAGSTEMNMACIHGLGALYRATGEERFLRMMREIEKDWERAGDYLRTGLAGTPFWRTPSPRWESLHDLQGLVELFRITGDARYRDAFVSHWRSIARSDRHPSGAFTTGERAVGNPYTDGAIETCCTTAWMALTLDMLRLTGDPGAADELELSTWNAVLASQTPTGRWWTYSTPINGKREASAHTIVFQARAGTPELNCCSVNGPRGLGILSEWAVLRGEKGLFINFYGPSRIRVPLEDGAKLAIEQDTRYPADGAIRIRIDLPRAARIPLHLRIPRWSGRTAVRVNGDAVRDPIRAGSFLLVDRTWRAGDAIEIDLDMTPVLWPGKRARRGKAAIYAGPLLLGFDPHFNAIDTDAIPPLDLAKLDLAPGSAPRAEGPGCFPPMVFFEEKTSGVRLCDFATCGAHGTDYAAWLPAVNAGSTPEWLTGDEGLVPLPRGPRDLIAASALDGDGKPSFGILESAKGIARATDRLGKEGGAVAFGGEACGIAYRTGAFPERDCTFYAWVCPKGLPADRLQQVFSAWAAGMDDPLRVVFQGDELFARIEEQKMYGTPGVRVENGTWIHVAAVKEGPKLTLYIDGEPRASADVPEQVFSAAADFAIGANPHYGGNECLIGLVDDFGLHGCALTAEEIARIHRTGKKPR
ncbi:MAG: glycoside hydrolase family 127 protein, partial [Planctomycetes bacterium]|nr:glycoside hydrolase family 127 protein [Planctomycetota bacterium]